MINHSSFTFVLVFYNLGLEQAQTLLNGLKNRFLSIFSLKKRPFLNENTKELMQFEKTKTYKIEQRRVSIRRSIQRHWKPFKNCFLFNENMVFV